MNDHSPLRARLEQAVREAGLEPGLLANGDIHPSRTLRRLHDVYAVDFASDVNPDAIDGDEWLENGTSFIYEVGVLTLIDSNKCDFIHVFIGQRRGADTAPEFIGHLHWRDGENDDPARTLQRVRKLLRSIHPVFHE